MTTTDLDLDECRKLCDGFRGRFEFQPEHAEDRGIGHVADTVDFDDRIVYFGEGDDHPEDAHVIADSIEQHVGEPLAQMLNTFPALVAEVRRLRECLAKANANHEEFERRWYLVTDELTRLRERWNADAEEAPGADRRFVEAVCVLLDVKEPGNGG